MPRIASSLERTGGALVYTHHTLTIVVGVWGLAYTQSPSVDRFLGGVDGSAIWSVIFVCFGAFALLCRVLHKWLDTTRPEAWCIFVLGVGRIVWGVLIIAAAAAASDDDNIQVGLALSAGGTFMPAVALLALAVSRRQRLAAADQSAQILAHVETEIRRSQGGT